MLLEINILRLLLLIAVLGDDYQLTLDFYALHASEVVQRYEVAPSPLAHRFAESFTSGCRILDIGCGSTNRQHSMVGHMSAAIEMTALPRGEDRWCS